TWIFMLQIRGKEMDIQNGASTFFSLMPVMNIRASMLETGSSTVTSFTVRRKTLWAENSQSDDENY
ncbi:hypothetical protein DPSP01_014719, partial [Paraphaeosphaeria sporulosa]